MTSQNYTTPHKDSFATPNVSILFLRRDRSNLRFLSRQRLDENTLVNLDSSLKRTRPHSYGDLTVVFDSTIISLPCWIHSKGYTRLDAGHEGQTLQDVCKVLQKLQQQGHEPAVEPSSTYGVVYLMPSSDPLQMSLRYGDLR
ncbi:hypothetical protein TNCV_3889481 [Trichonephila clavipes]|nr:hypothetical protein TNCV_3889481 [Trichonephila clavipes]